MNYSFINKITTKNYNAEDFLDQNKDSLYNTYNSGNNKIQNYNSVSYEQDKNNWATENSIQKTILKGVYTATPLGELYFCIENIQRIQKMIKYEIFKRTKGKYKLEVDQNETDLLVVMRATYISDAENSPYRLVHQVKILNNKTIEKIVPDMISIIKQDEEYINKLDKPIDPIPLPVNVSRAGRLSLPSVTTTF